MDRKFDLLVLAFTCTYSLTCLTGCYTILESTKLSDLEISNSQEEEPPNEPIIIVVPPPIIYPVPAPFLPIPEPNVPTVTKERDNKQNTRPDNGTSIRNRDGNRSWKIRRRR